MRFGEKTCEVDISRHDGLVLIMGKNGHGKSTIFDAICIALTGKPQREKTLGELISNVNEKGMWIQLDFELGDEEARIVRGQRPGILKFWVRPKGEKGDIEQEKWQRHTSSKADTEDRIRDYTALTRDLFRCTVINSTRIDTFFAMDAANQKRIVESLFKFDIYTKKAELIKADRQRLEGDLSVVKARIDERKISRARLKDMVEQERDRSDRWEADRAAKLATLAERISEIEAIDFDAIGEQRKRHAEALAAYTDVSNELKSFPSPEKIAADIESLDTKIAGLKELIDSNPDFDAAESAFDAVDRFLAEISDLQDGLREIRSEERAKVKEISDLEKTRDSVAGDETCPTCGQELPGAEERAEHAAAYDSKIAAVTRELEEIEGDANEIKEAILELESEAAAQDVHGFSSRSDLSVQRSKFERAVADLDALAAERNDLRGTFHQAEEEFNSLKLALDVAKETLDATPPPDLSETDVGKLLMELERSEKDLSDLDAAKNPHEEALHKMESEIDEEIDEAPVAELENEIKHRIFMEQLLIRKDSPLRRAATGRYLPALNDKMAKHLDRLGLDYSVTFEDDLSVCITDRGKKVTATSGGEEERLAMALNWAFRDVFEDIHGIRMTFMGIDERLDAALDDDGADAAIKILEENALDRGRTVWLITHKQEFLDYTDTVLRLTRTAGGYSTLEWRTQ